MEAAAITAGPVRNLMAMANVATELPQAMILGWRAINKPFNKHNKKYEKDEQIAEGLAGCHCFKFNFNFQ